MSTDPRILTADNKLQFHSTDGLENNIWVKELQFQTRQCICNRSSISYRLTHLIKSCYHGEFYNTTFLTTHFVTIKNTKNCYFFTQAQCVLYPVHRHLTQSFQIPDIFPAVPLPQRDQWWTNEAYPLSEGLDQLPSVQYAAVSLENENLWCRRDQTENTWTGC